MIVINPPFMVKAIDRNVIKKATKIPLDNN